MLALQPYSSPAARRWSCRWPCGAWCRSGRRWAASWAGWSGSHGRSAGAQPPSLRPPKAVLGMPVGTVWTAAAPLCCCSGQTPAPPPAGTALCTCTGSLEEQVVGNVLMELKRIIRCQTEMVNTFTLRFKVSWLDMSTNDWNASLYCKSSSISAVQRFSVCVCVCTFILILRVLACLQQHLHEVHYRLQNLHPHKYKQRHKNTNIHSINASNVTNTIIL